MRFLKLNNRAIVLALLTLGCFSFQTIASQNDSDIRYVIKYKNGKKSSIKNILAANRAKVHIELDPLNAFSTSLNSHALEALSNNPNIAYIEKEVKGQYLTQITPYTNPMIQSNLITAQGVMTRKVCILDTGINLSHEDFDSSLISGTAAVGEGDWFTDENGHGTYMSGSIIALNNSIGVEGIAPSTIALHFHKLGMDFSSSRLADGILQCINNNANAISMSLNISNSQILHDAVIMAYDNDILLTASAGNDADTSLNYPASYPEVMSVAGVDNNKEHAYYSNRNSEVEIAAPASRVWGTTPMGERVVAETIFDNLALDTLPLHGTPIGNVSAPVVDCGAARKSCPNVSGKICLIKAAKTWVTTNVQNCESGGGIGALVYNDAIHAYEGEVGVKPDSMGNLSVTIPGVTISDAMAATILSNPAALASINSVNSNYSRAYGTSISSPIVAGAAMVAWSHHLDCSNIEIRQAINASAEDLGVIGRDDSYGNGLVQMAAAKHYLDANPCGTEPPLEEVQLTVSKLKSKGKWYTHLNWINVTSSNVDIYRDGSYLTTLATNTSYSESTLTGTHSYQVCEQGSSSCSSEVMVTH